MILAKPVIPTRVPKSPGTRTEMSPLPEVDLEEVYADAIERDQRLADLLLIDAWTGLRWSELRAIRVRDFVEVPMPLLIVQRAAPEGVRVKVPKSGKSRRVPVADRVLPLVRSLIVGRAADDLLWGHVVRSPAARLGVQANARVDEGGPGPADS